MRGLAHLSWWGVAALTACTAIPPPVADPVLRARAPTLQLDESGQGAWPVSHWWQRYGDADLDALLERALAGGPSIQSASTRFVAAQAAVREVAARYGVQLDGRAAVQRQRLSDNGLFPPAFLGFHWYNQADLSLSATYQFDWWGQQRQAIRAVLDQQRAAQVERQAAALTLATAVADTYFAWQADQASLTLTNERLAAATRQRSLASARVGAGLARPEEIGQTDLALAATRERVMQLETSAALRRVKLAALIGIAPEALPALSARALPPVQPQLPEHLSIDLIARRPDITASRWRVDAASHNLQSIRAGFYPDISLRALVGLSSLDLAHLLEGSSRVPAIGAAVHLPFFDRAQLSAAHAGGQAQLARAVDEYDSTVVTAAREVSSAALERGQWLRQAEEQRQSVEVAAALRSQAGARVAHGLSDARPEIQATLQWLDAEESLVQAQAAALSADIALAGALGGGFDAAMEP